MRKIEIIISEIEIRQVKDIFFVVHEEGYIANPSKKIKIVLDFLQDNDIANNQVTLTARVYLHYENASPDQILAEIQVKNVFRFPSLKPYLEGKEVVLSDEVMIVLVSISLSHTRALFAKSLSGTSFSGVLLPVVNVLEVTKLFFPRSFSKPVDKQVRKKTITDKTRKRKSK